MAAEAAKKDVLVAVHAHAVGQARRHSSGRHVAVYGAGLRLGAQIPPRLELLSEATAPGDVDASATLPAEVGLDEGGASKG